MVRYMSVMMVALFIDGLQALVSVAFFTLGSALQALTPVGGAIAGAVVGAGVCWDQAGGIISGITEAAKCSVAGGVFGAAASAIGAPLGVALGIMVNICISLTLGLGFLVLLVFLGLLRPGPSLGVLFGEMIPGFSNLPLWTAFTLKQIMNEAAQDIATKLLNTFAPVIQSLHNINTYSGATKKPLDRVYQTQAQEGSVEGEDQIAQEEDVSNTSPTPQTRTPLIDGVRIRPRTRYAS